MNKFKESVALFKDAFGKRLAVASADNKKIEGEIWELRPLDNRILFFAWNGNAFVLLHHFVKKTQKTPKNEIEQAQQNMLNFKKQNQKKGL